MDRKIIRSVEHQGHSSAWVVALLAGSDMLPGRRHYGPFTGLDGLGRRRTEAPQRRPPIALLLANAALSPAMGWWEREPEEPKQRYKTRPKKNGRRLKQMNWDERLDDLTDVEFVKR